MLLKYVATACQDKTLRKYVCKDTEVCFHSLYN